MADGSHHVPGADELEQGTLRGRTRRFIRCFLLALFRLVHRLRTILEV